MLRTRRTRIYLQVEPQTFQSVTIKFPTVHNRMSGIIERIIAEAEASESPLMARTKQVHRRSAACPWKRKEIVRARLAAEAEAEEHAAEAQRQRGLNPQLMLDLDSSYCIVR